jgi:hypothetical protein
MTRIFAGLSVVAFEERMIMTTALVHVVVPHSIRIIVQPLHTPTNRSEFILESSKDYSITLTLLGEFGELIYPSPVRLVDNDLTSVHLSNQRFYFLSNRYDL